MRIAKRKCGSQISDVQDKASKASNIEMPKLDIPDIEMGDVISEANVMLEACTSVKSRFGSMPNMLSKIDMSEYLNAFYKMIPHPAIDLGFRSTRLMVYSKALRCQAIICPRFCHKLPRPGMWRRHRRFYW